MASSASQALGLKTCTTSFSSIFIYLANYLFLLYACMLACVFHVHSAHGGQKGAPDPLELELQTLVSHPMGAGN